MIGNCRTCGQSLSNKLVGERVSEEDAIAVITEAIDSVGYEIYDLGGAKAEASYRALEAAGYAIYEIEQEKKTWWDSLTADERKEYYRKRAKGISHD